MKQPRHSLKLEKVKETLFNGANICVSSCGKYLFCVYGTRVNVIDIESGTIKNSFESEEEEISCIQLSPNDERLITAHRSSLLLKQWSNWRQFPAVAADEKMHPTLKCTRTWKALHTAPVVHMQFDSSSVLLATCGSDYTTKVWDLQAQYCTHNLKGAAGISRCVRFYPQIDRKQELVVGGDDGKVRVYDLNESSQVHVFDDGHFSTITCLEYCGGANRFDRLLSSSRDKVLILWDMTNYTKLRTIPVFESIESFQFLDGNGSGHVVTMGNAGLLKLWNVDTGRQLYAQDSSVSLKTRTPSRTATAADDDLDSCILQSVFNRATNTLVLLTVDDSIVFVRVQSDLAEKLGQQKSISSSDNDLFCTYKQFIGDHGEILDVKYADSAERLLAVATNSQDLKIYDLNSWDCKLLKGHSDLIICLAVYIDSSSNISYLASSSKDSQIILWRISAPKEISTATILADYKFEKLQVCRGHTQDVGALSFSKEAFLFLISASIDTTIKLWRVRSSEEAETKTTPLSVGFTVKAHEKDINSVCVSQNNKLFASGSTDKTAKIWDSGDGSCLAVLRGHRRGIWCIEFSPIDQMVATSSADASIKLWSLSDFSCLKTLEGHNTSVLRVFFLNQGTQLVSSASDGLIKLWSIKSSECVGTFDEHEDKCWSLLVAHDEQRMISGGADGRLIVWRDITDEILGEELEKRQDILLKEQELENCMKDKKWKKALGLALLLDKPFRCYAIVKEILEETGKTENINAGRLRLEKTLTSLREDQIIDWNTNTRYCHLAQVVFELIMRNYPPEFFIETTPNTNTSSNSDVTARLIEQFMPYTERHLARLNKLAQQIMFIDYTWQNMRLDDDNNEQQASSKPNYLTFNTNTNQKIELNK